MQITKMHTARLILLVATVVISFKATDTLADIYKWRDSNGVIKYADNLPADQSSRSSHTEIIHYLQATQKQDYCVLPLAKKTVYSGRAYFFGTNFSNNLNNKTNNKIPLGNNAVFGKTTNAISWQASPSNVGSKNSPNLIGNKSSIGNLYAPLNAASFFNFGGKAITAFTKPIKIAQNKPIPAPKPAPTPTPTTVPVPSPIGQTFYIAPDGNNNNVGTEALPWRNLNHAVYALKAGETVLVKNGTYQESLYINKSGTAGKPITYKAYPGHKPKIEINRKELEGILIQGASYINIEGFEVAYTALGAEAAKGEQTDNGIDISNAGQVLSHHINIKNNNVHGFPGGGIFTVLADYVTFEGNTVWQNALWAKWGNSGISMYQNVNVDLAAGYHMIIRGNTIYKNENKLPSFAIGSTTITDGNCIIIDDLRLTQKFLDNKTNYPAYKYNTLIENNICYDNGARGIHVYSSDNVLVRNNTLYKNQRTSSINDGELTAIDASNVRFVNNIVYAMPSKKANGTYNVSNVTFERNLYFGSSEIPNKSASDIVVDPLFTNPSLNPSKANFSLKTGSPAIDAALAGQSPAIDITGLLRGAKADIGAIEAQ